MFDILATERVTLRVLRPKNGVV